MRYLSNCHSLCDFQRQPLEDPRQVGHQTILSGPPVSSALVSITPCADRTRADCKPCKMRPTQILCRHYRKLRLTTKDVNKGFYKGTGTGSMGRHTKHGGYVIEYHKVRTYVVPEGLADFKVRRSLRDSLALPHLCSSAGTETNSYLHPRSSRLLSPSK